MDWISPGHAGRRWLLTAGLVLVVPADSGFSIIHRFLANAGYPGAAASLTSSRDGGLYGTTCQRAAGSIFSIDASARVRERHAFDNACPIGGVVEGEDGALFGVAQPGDRSAAAFVYKIPRAGKLTTIATFDNYSPGGRPQGTLTRDSDGLLYGVAADPGDPGSVFRIQPSGHLSVLAAFPGNGTAGVDPVGSLVEAADGYFYGATSAGGSLGAGTIYRVGPKGELTVVHAFDPKTEGRSPAGGLMVGVDGSLYGTLRRGSTSASGGVIYRLFLDGTFTRVHEFGANDGSDPVGELSLASDGSAAADGFLYGVTRAGGANRGGTVYRLNINTGALIVLHAFDWAAAGTTAATGVIQGSDDALYGVAEGSANSATVLFRLNPATHPGFGPPPFRCP